MAGDTAPDFRICQDERKIVLINVFGDTIARSVRRLLQALVLSDIHQSVFRRKQKDSQFLWWLDESQTFFITQQLRDIITDLVCLSRSFGSYFLFLTQNMSTAVSDPRLLKILYTNIRWSFSMRGEPGDCAFLKPALPVTGRKLQPQSHPFQESRFYSLAEERQMALEAIAHLPDRVGHLWFKTRSAQALQMRTRELAIPQGRDLEEAVLPLWRDPTIGMRLSRQEYESRIAKREREWAAEEPGQLSAALADAYRRVRGEGT